MLRKEVIKLLDNGIIFSISDSKWVRPIQVVLKKGGLTVVKNEFNNLVPTRLSLDGVCALIIKSLIR